MVEGVDEHGRRFVYEGGKTTLKGCVCGEDSRLVKFYARLKLEWQSLAPDEAVWKQL